jgi:glycosyltransferase involved in cell wall biosynthesis
MNDKSMPTPEINVKNLIETIPSRLIKKPLVSVSMITYNHEKYIEEAINGVLMQEVDFDVELIISNDNSPDQTDTIIQKILKEHPKSHCIKYIKNKKNLGIMQNLADNLKSCKGQYIAICEGDDYWTDSTKLQKQVQFLEDFPEYVITYTNSQAFDENGLVNIDFGGVKRDVSADELKKGIPIYTLTTCFRNVLKEIPMDLLSAKLGDVIIWSLLGAYGKGKYLADILPAAYRVHKEGVFSMQSEQQKIRMTLITSNALFAYYNRIGDIDNGLYFGEQSIKLFIKLIGWNRLITMIIEKIQSRFIQIFKKLR